MDTSKWLVFVKIAELSSVSLASEELNISQSGTSYILKSLEQEVGFPLFNRTKKGVKLTDNGVIILPKVKNLISQEEKIKDICNEICGLSIANLRIGTFSSLAIGLLPGIIDEFNADFPAVKIDIIEGASDEIEDDLLLRRINLALTSYRKRNDFEWIDLEKDYLKAIIPKSEAMLVDEVVPLTYFEDNPMINSSATYEHDVSSVLDDYQIFPKKIVFSSQDESTILALVGKDLGASLLFDRILSVHDYSDVLVRQTNPEVFRRLGIAYSNKNDLSPAAKKFIQYAEAFVKNRK